MLVRAWYRGSAWLRLLRPLEWLFRALARRRRRGFEQHPERVWQPPVPLIVVGNITVGGTGKTPLVLYLVDWARRRGLRPGVVSRGYGARPPTRPFVVRPDGDAGECGDEPLLIAGRSNCPLVIDPDRAAAARFLLEHFDCDLIISDDGLQHYALGRDVEILVLDSERGLGNGRCLPEGPLREPPQRIGEVDLVVVNGGGEFCPDGAHRMQLTPSELVSLRDGKRCAAVDWTGGRRVHAVAGIGNPQRFFETLRQLGFDPVPHSFADHHAFGEQDLVFDERLPLIMTEKDAVKCRHLAPPDSWYLPVEAKLTPEFESALASKLNTDICTN
ncbi:tetraacyldisaccharide 4'-kinase [Marinobacterium nitratireducens]|uniref:Tetraacyldisaccharide 4'-kinase n=1 Tax=Marinobacterium nitratireducens TaxID=518897 RepID=A0A918DSJ5_9GAMM|nr:tetraacyldisaccharide 4'-kinase [Marinobacterium nitratireducens]GGO80369.1 tetraacyldisaccharide 4'-kinase [Marinobacterium nitratireducens]